MRVLFISEYYPFNVRTDVTGVFKRMRMLLEAMQGLGELDVLFLAPPGVDTSPAALRRLEGAIQAAWDLRLNVFVREQSTGHAAPSTRAPAALDSLYSPGGGRVRVRALAQQ